MSFADLEHVAIWASILLSGYFLRQILQTLFSATSLYRFFGVSCENFLHDSVLWFLSFVSGCTAQRLQFISRLFDTYFGSGDLYCVLPRLKLTFLLLGSYELCLSRDCDL